MPSKKINFLLDDTRLLLIKGLKKQADEYADKDFYYQAVSTVDASILLHNLVYEDSKSQINL